MNDLLQFGKLSFVLNFHNKKRRSLASFDTLKNNYVIVTSEMLLVLHLINSSVTNDFSKNIRNDIIESIYTSHFSPGLYSSIFL